MLLSTYDPITKEYTGQKQANLDPLETELQGHEVFAIPAFATHVSPILEEGKVSVYDIDSKTWTNYADNRGLLVYDKKTGEPFVINTIGDIPDNYVTEKPFMLQEEKIALNKQVNVAFTEAVEEVITLDKVRVNIATKAKLDSLIEFIGDNTYGSFTDLEGNVVMLTKEELKYYSHYLYVRSIMLTIKQIELKKQIKNARNEASLKKVKVTTNVTKDVNKAVKFSKEELEEYIKEST